MPERLTWLVPNRVIFCQLAGDLTLMDFDEFVADVESYVKQTTETVHFVQDLRLVTKPNLNLADVRKFIRLNNDFTGWYLGYGQYNNSILRFLTIAAARILDVNMQPLFKDYTEMRVFLQKLEPDLDIPEEAPELFREADFLLPRMNENSNSS